VAKQVERFEIVIRGTKADGPQSASVSYRLQDSSDTTLKSNFKQKTLTSPNLAKKIHDTGAVGEFWKDELAAVETDEGI
jgi:hypothetical protein